MLFRSCAGGVVFYENTVLLLQNEKKEWVLPKGIIRTGMTAPETAVARVKTEAGVTAEVLSIAGHTTYEFYSATRQRPVCNDIAWYLMKAANGESAPNRLEGFVDGGYYTIPQGHGAHYLQPGPRAGAQRLGALHRAEEVSERPWLLPKGSLRPLAA